MKLDREDVALKIFCALISNPERYKYIAEKVEASQLTNYEATQKNIDKSFKMADQFMNTAFGIKEQP